MTDKMISLEAHDGGTFSAYLATPAGGQGPAVVVIQEIFGINANVRSICDDYAARGYFAIAPDLFWRQEPGIQLTPAGQEEWDKAFALYQGFNVDLGIADLKTSLDHVRHLQGTNGKVGVTGYCLGGMLTYLMAARSDADAAAGYYGVGIHEALSEAKNISAPLILHIAEEDGFVDKQAQQAMHDGLDSHPNITLYDYPGVDHAFAREGGDHYDKDAATLANKRTADLFAKYLK